MHSREIDFDTLAKFGLNRFSILVTESKLAGLKVETQPVEITEVCDAMTELLPGSIESAALTGASATMMSDGSMVMSGFHKEARPRLAALLRKGRDAYFGNVLQPMYDDTTRLNIARDVATALICNGIDPSELTIKMMCGCGTCSTAADLVSFVQSKVGGLAKSKEVFVPASCGRLNGDFRQMFDHDIEQRFQHMIKDAMAEVAPTLTENLRLLQKGLEIAAKYAAMM